MNPLKIFNKWWLMLVEGILLIILSYFLFSHTGKLFDATMTTTGFIALLTGTVAIIGYFLASKNEKNIVELITGLFSGFAGIFFLSAVPLAKELVIWFFAIFMIFTASKIIAVSWQLKDEIKWWGLSILQFIYTLMVLLIFITGSSLFDIPITVFAAMQFFISGILMTLFAFVVQKIQDVYNQTISQIRNH